LNETAFEPRHDQIVSEHFENEVVVVNLENGAYFSLRGSAERIWNWLIQGVTPPAIVDHLAGDASAPADQIRSDVLTLIQHLSDEGLIRPCSAPPRPIPADAEAAGSYSPPAFEKYTDMQDLLLLDPIHDVDDSGWPRQPQGPEQGAVPAE